MKKILLVIIVLILGALAVFALKNIIKPSAITNNKSPTGTTNSKPTTPSVQPKSTPSPNTVNTPLNTPPPAPLNQKALSAKSWQWVTTKYSNGTEIIPKNTSKFLITFRTDGNFVSLTDCNNIGGKYSLDGINILFSEVMSTQMYCSGSQEDEYQKIFRQAQTFTLLPSGNLRIDLKFGEGYATFR